MDEEAAEKDKRPDEPTMVETIDNEDDLLYGDAPAFQMPIISQPKATDSTTKKSPWYFN